MLALLLATSLTFAQAPDEQGSFMPPSRIAVKTEASPIAAPPLSPLLRPAPRVAAGTATGLVIGLAIGGFVIVNAMPDNPMG